MAIAFSLEQARDYGLDRALQSRRPSDSWDRPVQLHSCNTSTFVEWNAPISRPTVISYRVGGHESPNEQIGSDRREIDGEMPDNYLAVLIASTPTADSAFSAAQTKLTFLRIVTSTSRFLRCGLLRPARRSMIALRDMPLMVTKTSKGNFFRAGSSSTCHSSRRASEYLNGSNVEISPPLKRKQLAPNSKFSNSVRAKELLLELRSAETNPFTRMGTAQD